MKCLHRDLAARNVLVCSRDILKISDFGMAKDVHYTEYYRKSSTVRSQPAADIARSVYVSCVVLHMQAVCPVKWTSPEALLNKVYTEASA